MDQRASCESQDYRQWADKAIAGEALTRDEARAVLDTPDAHLLSLLDAAYAIRRQFFGRKVRLQMLQNAKSGACQEDCGYCSQSNISTADIDQYGLLSKAELFDGVARAVASKAVRFFFWCIGWWALCRVRTSV